MEVDRMSLLVLMMTDKAMELSTFPFRREGGKVGGVVVMMRGGAVGPTVPLPFGVELLLLLLALFPLARFRLELSFLVSFPLRELSSVRSLRPGVGARLRPRLLLRPPLLGGILPLAGTETLMDGVGVDGVGVSLLLVVGVVAFDVLQMAMLIGGPLLDREKAVKRFAVVSTSRMMMRKVTDVF